VCSACNVNGAKITTGGGETRVLASLLPVGSNHLPANESRLPPENAPNIWSNELVERKQESEHQG